MLLPCLFRQVHIEGILGFYASLDAEKLPGLIRQGQIIGTAAICAIIDGVSVGFSASARFEFAPVDYLSLGAYCVCYG